MLRPGELLFLAGFGWILKIRWPHRSKVRKRQHSRQDRLERALLAGMTLGFWFLPFLSALTRRLRRFDYPMSPLGTAAGALLFGSGVALLHVAHRDLGKQFSPTLELAYEHELVTHGVYSRIRHPMYTAGFLWALGQILLVPNLLGGPPALIAHSALVALRLPREEAMLRETFGADYEEWRRRTGALWPRF